MSKNSMLENANKVTFIIEQFPKHNLTQALSLLQLPPIDINAAVWYAQELGWLSQPKDERVELLKTPGEWNFGDKEAALEELLVFVFNQLAKNETDLEENYLSNWTDGYAAHDILIAMKRLINDQQMFQYKVQDGENTYTFFTLYANREKEWGRKQFKQAPKPSAKAAVKRVAKQINVSDESDNSADVEVKKG